MLSKAASTSPPKVTTVAIATTAINATIMAYSTMVAPDSSCTKRRISSCMGSPPGKKFLMLGMTVPGYGKDSLPNLLCIRRANRVPPLWNPSDAGAEGNASKRFPYGYTVCLQGAPPGNASLFLEIARKTGDFVTLQPAGSCKIPRRLSRFTRSGPVRKPKSREAARVRCTAPADRAAKGLGAYAKEPRGARSRPSCRQGSVDSACPYHPCLSRVPRTGSVGVLYGQ